MWSAFLDAMRELDYVEGRNLVVRRGAVGRTGGGSFRPRRPKPATDRRPADESTSAPEGEDAPQGRENQVRDRTDRPQKPKGVASKT